MNEPDLRNVAVSWAAAMRRGDYEEAWRQTDRIELPRRMREAAGAFVREPQHLMWNGHAFRGREVVVRCDHGLGDTLQFFRFIPRLHALARKLTVLVQPPLVTLLAGCRDAGEIRDGWAEPAPRADVEIEIMELAYAFRSTLETLPNRVPYLPISGIRQCAAALPALADANAFRVGLVWAGSDWDTSRSIPLDVLDPLSAVKGARFYSLQQGAQADAWRHARFRIEPLSQHTAEIVTAAAAMLELDLVVTVDAMTAHLAGALGRPVWVLLKHEADWRWMGGRSDSPWYPTMRLFRQPHAGDWASVAQAVAAALAQAAASRSGVDYAGAR
jgi:hypothetical protein